MISEPPAMKKEKNEWCTFDLMVAAASHHDCLPSTRSAVMLSVYSYRHAELIDTSLVFMVHRTAKLFTFSKSLGQPDCTADALDCAPNR